MTPEDRAFVYQHAKAYGGEDYADWYMANEVAEDDTMEDLRSHPSAWLRFERQ